MKGLKAQSGEDRMLLDLFRKIGTTNHVAVEFGALDGVHGSNTAFFRGKGWRVELFDRAPIDPIVHQVTITAANINTVFDYYDIPHAFDLLSIDIDGNDLWVWKALNRKPRVVVIEFNPKWKPTKARTVPYNPERFWDGSNYYGASVRALWLLGQEKGYGLVDFTRSNLIFTERGLRMAIRPEDVPLRRKQKRADPLDRAWVAYP